MRAFCPLGGKNVACVAHPRSHDPEERQVEAEQEECKTGGSNGGGGGTYTKKEGKKVRRSITQSKGQSSRGSVVTDIDDEDLPSVRKLRCSIELMPFR